MKTFFAALVLIGVWLNPSLAQSPVRDLKDNQTILRVQRCAGLSNCNLTVTVNGKTVPPGTTNNDIAWTDISDKVKPGVNTVKLTWDNNVDNLTVFVSYATRKGDFREILKTQETTSSGIFKTLAAQNIRERTYTFVVPAAGDDNRAGSKDRQTVIRGQAPANFTVFINGQRIVDLSRWELTLDVSKFVKPGENQIRLVWQVPVPGLWLRIAYAPTKNKFQELTFINLNGQAVADKPGEKTVIFTVPK
jgi:hypothetical protein